MDVMNPELLWVDGRSYRVNPVSSSYNFTATGPYEEEDTPVTPGQGADDDDSHYYDSDESEVHIEEISGGKFRASMDVASAYFPFIVGSKGVVKKRLQLETRTNINIPPPGRSSGDIVITGPDRSSVRKALTRLEILIHTAKKKQPFTHFISIPVNSEAIRTSFETFKENVLEECEGSIGVDCSLFQTPHKLHLTIGTLVLLSDHERKEAAEILACCKSEVMDPILHNAPLKITMRGLEYMNDDPSDVDVLYGKVESEENPGQLQHLANEIVRYFSRKGLMTVEHENVKLHATVMNTLFRTDDSGDLGSCSTKRGTKPRESFDASKILKLYDTFDFGTQHVQSIHLSLRHSTAANGYYQCTSSVSLN